MNGYVLLAAAIICEIFATSMMKASAGFTKIIPSILFVVVMGASFYALSQALIQIPLSIAYAIWSGLGTALTSLVALFVWKESMNIYTFAGMVFIIIGVVLLNLKGAGH
ncbi:DMT family transporter [Pelosinus propionicus]|uniref:Small multidrug resistance pump n=1 Tax=Pelosinus propionicus DSM 13327 TaxID=1123291 RepID=A0A1I4IZE8_9FIRM|nr:multidrug efflux SMR transporter [Pelosinus propionicus]SFL59650.1 small multidrug resistance pump [Pelosinus propionicus DSM 13327]